MAEEIEIPETPPTEVSESQLGAGTASLGTQTSPPPTPAPSPENQAGPGVKSEAEFYADFDGRGKGQEGRKRGKYKTRNGEPRTIEVNRAPEKTFDKEAARLAGEKMGQLLIGIVGQFHPNSLPQTDTERSLAKTAVAQTGQYFVDKEMPDLPPSLALVFAWGTYYMVVASAERNREAVQTFWGNFKSKWAQWNAARKAKKQVEREQKS